MHRLSGTDSVFLSIETPAWHQHVAGLVVLDPSGADHFGFDAVRRTIAERIHLVPKLRWKIEPVPFGIDRPVWVDDDEFDLDRHLHRAAVAAPGGHRELNETLGPILGSQLDRRYPLWEITFLEGLVNGRAGVVMKYHHCMLDGMAGSQMASLLLDLEPEPSEPVAPPEPALADEPPPPSPAELLVQGVGTLATAPVRAIGFGARLAWRGVEVGRHLATSSNRSDLSAMVASPRTSFNQTIGPRRALAFASVSLDDVRTVRRHFGIKVNDVMLALSAGALREYLISRDELPTRSLTSGMPVSLRTDQDTAFDNQVSSLAVPLATDVEDPVERLQAIARNTRATKELGEVIAEHPIGSFGATVPPFMLEALARVVSGARVMSVAPPVINTVVSNVVGPPIPLYLAGARLVGIYSASLLFDSMGLNITCFTFEDRIDFGVHVDPELVADPWLVADGIPRALGELMAAAGLGAPTAVEDPFGLVSESK